MDELGSWSWGTMRLSFLYEQLSLTFDSSVISCGGYMTLLVVIIVFLIFYLLDHKCIFSYNTCADINLFLCVCRDGL